MNQRQMECLLAVDETGSFAKAGERLHLSQPAVSNQIRALEDELGFAVFQRDSHHVALTPAGAVIRDLAAQIILEINDAVAEAAALDSGIQQFHLGYFGEFNDFFPVLFSFLRHDAPRLAESLTLDRIMPSDLLHKTTLKQFSAIIAHQGTALEKKGVPFEPIFLDHHYCLLSRDHPLAGRRSLSLEELRGETFILPPRENWVPHLTALKSLPGGDVLACSIDSRSIQSASASTLLKTGIAIVPWAFLTGNPRLTAIPLEPDIPYEVGILWGNASVSLRPILRSCMLKTCRKLSLELL